MRAWTLGLYVAVVTSLGVWVLARAAIELHPIEPRLVLLAALAVVAGVGSVRLPGTGARLNADTPFLLSLVAAGAGDLAILASAAAQVAGTLTARASARRIPFAAAAGAASTAFAVVVADAFAAFPAPVAVLSAGFASFVASNAIGLGAIRLSSGRLPGRGWREALPVSAAAHLVSASLGHLLQASGSLVSTVLLVAPIALLLARYVVSHRERVEERVAREVERETVFLPTLEALVAAIEARDPVAHGHNQRVRNHALGCARALGLRDEATLLALRYGAALHDIGRIAIPDHLLHAAGVLSAEELEAVRRHAMIGCELIRHVPFPPGVVEVVRNHHERWDGKGYPDRLAGEAIPLPARIVAVADAFDDLCSGGWRPALSPAAALRVLEDDAGTAFDPVVVAGFARAIRLQGVVEDERSELSLANAEIRMVAREQARLSDLAFHDELTGLRNGRALQRDLTALCSGGRAGVALMLDLDGFKRVNDTYGHEAGDRALRIVADALAHLPAPAAAYRNGGDEFVVLVPNAVGWTAHAEAARAAVEACSLPVHDGRIPLRTSVGGTSIVGRDAAGVLHAADEAMYEAKQRRRGFGGQRSEPPGRSSGQGTMTSAPAWPEGSEPSNVGSGASPTVFGTVHV